MYNNFAFKHSVLIINYFIIPSIPNAPCMIIFNFKLYESSYLKYFCDGAKLLCKFFSAGGMTDHK